MKLPCKKQFGKLVPVGEHAEAQIAKLKHDEIVMCEVKRPKSQRSIQHHRLFFALLHKAFENQSAFKTEEDFLDALKLAVGHTRELKTKDGIHVLPESINFASMDQEEFNVFFEKCAEVLANAMNVSVEELKGEAREAA